MAELDIPGLSKNEAKVFEALLELGEATPGEIAARTDLHRPNVYNALEVLLRRGLAETIVKNKKRFYSSLGADALLRLVEGKEDEVRKERARIEELLPRLRKIASTAKKPKAGFVEGKDGLRTLFEDVLATLAKGGEHLVINPTFQSEEILGDFLRYFRKQKAAKRISTKFILTDRPEDRALAKALTEEYPRSEARLIPREYASALAINIYGNKTALLLWVAGEPFGVVIEDEGAAKGFRNYFELLWGIARKAW